jgi:hypothetical protein
MPKPGRSISYDDIAYKRRPEAGDTLLAPAFAITAMT